jgi:hypothetical protein
MTGASVSDCSIHDNFQRAMTIHDSLDSRGAWLITPLVLTKEWRKERMEGDRWCLLPTVATTT